VFDELPKQTVMSSVAPKEVATKFVMTLLRTCQISKLLELVFKEYIVRYHLN
jgi:hypothetical protein